MYLLDVTNLEEVIFSHQAEGETPREAYTLALQAERGRLEKFETVLNELVL